MNFEKDKNNESPKNSVPIDPLLVETELADYCISELDSSRVASQIPGADLALTNYVLDGASKNDLILEKGKIGISLLERITVLVEMQVVEHIRTAKDHRSRVRD